MFSKDTHVVMKLIEEYDEIGKISYPITFKITESDLKCYIKKNNPIEGTSTIIKDIINEYAGNFIPSSIVTTSNGVDLFQIVWLQDISQQEYMSDSFYNNNYDSIKNEYNIYIPGHLHKINYTNNTFSSNSYTTLP